MRVLILTQYFPPEIGAPQNRLFELAVRLQKKGIDVEVFTAMPNYPKMEIHDGYKDVSYRREILEGIPVYRSWIYTTKSKSIVPRLLNYFSFVFSSFFFGLFKLKGKYDLIVVESPPLFLGISGWLLSIFKSAKLSMNISDLWPESAEKMELVTNKYMLKTATWLEEFLYRKSAFISGQTQGIVKNIKERFPEKKVYWLPNGVDIERFNAELFQKGWRKENNFNEDDLLFLYGGIIGHAQGLEVILKCAQIVQGKSPKAKFILLGAGPLKQELIELKAEMGLSNVFFFEPVTKKEMGNIIIDTDCALVPLKKMDLFLGAIPSKIFENLALKKPILLGVDGEAKELFVERGECAVFFEPENHEMLSEIVISIIEGNVDLEALGNNGRAYVEKDFNRDKIAEEYHKFVKECLG
jgi:glycosyltransferase involved in cell wall biosynthesis